MSGDQVLSWVDQGTLERVLRDKMMMEAELVTGPREGRVMAGTVELETCVLAAVAVEVGS